jgi:nicotinate-nucleotide adenylyltransferase
VAKSKNIALFGGSFNPPHAGHYEIARRLARRKGIDEVWILPVYRHVFGKKMPLFGRRLRACRGFFKGLGPKVKVKDWEKRLGGVSYTVRLLRFFKKRYPTARFSLAVGSDAYRERRSWKDFPEIQRLARLIVFPRGPKSPIPDVSSTAIRALQARKRLR